ncbi:CobW family GTP-binding protein [Neisseria sp. Ec49-e6-T10]|uniref:CobW family GTP-binding protein n=1 Tax=Neisseria sp. Ec49-e6-T10 TaxID=3140744 RepID=UPI003EBA660C
MDQMRTALPVTVLTGFLGSGKTTLINYLLDHHQNEKIAIVENEFGSVGIDGGLLKGKANVEVIELSNGCVCCSVRGELTEALHDLLAQIDSGALQIDRLILETTGLADPAPIIQTFFVDEAIRERIVLDAVVTLVDCEHVLKQLDEHRVAASQIGFADRLILTKADRVTEEDKEQLLQRLAQINNRAQIYEAQFGQLPREAWVGIQAFDLDDTLNITTGFHLIEPKEQNKIQFKAFSKGKAFKQSWEDDISSYVFKAGDMDIKLIGQFMEDIIERFGNDMLRYKGVLSIQAEDRRLIVQGVHKVVGFDYGSVWLENESRQSLLVIIGRKLPFDDLEQEFINSESK